MNITEIKQLLGNALFSDETPVEFLSKEDYPIAKEFFNGICSGNKDYIDYMRRFSIEKKEDYPIAEEFFDGICCGDKDYIDYVRRYCAYCFSSMSDRCFYIRTGPGFSGKSPVKPILDNILDAFYTRLSRRCYETGKIL